MSTLQEVRRTLADALVQAQAADQLSPEQLQAFVVGDEPLSARQLELDSLAAMELLVAIELEHGVSLGPEQLATLPSLAALAERVIHASCVSTQDATAQAGGFPVDLAPSTTRPQPTDPSPRILQLFKRAHARCRGSVARQRQLEIELGHRLTPRETATLWQQANKQPELAFSQHLWRMCQSAGKSQPEAFERRRMSHSVSLYQHPQSEPGRELLICATGAARRMMVPIPVFLQHLDAQRFDVLLLQDRRRDSYQTGLLGTPTRQLSEIPGWLSASGWLDAYPTVRVAGVSGGGFLATLIALQLGLTNCLCIGGRFPKGRQDEYLRLAKDATRCAPRSSTAKLLLAYGWWRCGQDRKFAKAMAPVIAAETQCVRIGLHKVNHNVLNALQRQGRLRQFIDQTICKADIAPLHKATS